ncbi:type II toxin-antitoxin system VapC family toxin [Nitrosococcus wardiae]|uniref:Type II toxin-antitoxin system VapC family toxin n=1 Tax=Nitrosococcus wardiae TaxID=1814290 RepID=A0A4P7BXY5_9GAMM|nr:type II toxin-antitoxin system VapC family toxin [Nitrosococcus wardiae]QBQ53256.1 type II toxin-antitoxin system VapC family toxin [Nitrosococcus wardiae]
MRTLLDTHVFLWLLTEDPRLSPTARRLFLDEENQLFLSMASVWEIAIKTSLGRLEFMEPIEDLLPRELRLNGIHLLPIEIGHALKLARLPFHHRDPFDRLLVAQSLAENLPLLSADNHLDAYPIKRFWQ